MTEHALAGQPHAVRVLVLADLTALRAVETVGSPLGMAHRSHHRPLARKDRLTVQNSLSDSGL